MAQGEPERRRDRARSPRRRDRRPARSRPRCTSSSAPTASTRSSRCAAAAGSAPAPSSSASDVTDGRRSGARARRGAAGDHVGAASEARPPRRITRDVRVRRRSGCAIDAFDDVARRGRSRGLPDRGPEMILAVTDRRLLVYHTSFWSGRPTTAGGSIDLDRVHTVAVKRHGLVVGLAFALDERRDRRARGDARLAAPALRARGDGHAGRPLIGHAREA